MSHEKARKILPEAEFRPPARKGDLLRLAASQDVSMVGLVDGVFLQDYPPTPIEVCQLARRQGVLLAGAASLGALRAVELEKFGMVGIGRVFELYKSGKLNADDEVAVTFADSSDGNFFRLQSEAMVDIRYNLFLAYKKGVVGKDTKKAIARVAKGTYFPHRNYHDIIEATRQKYSDISRLQQDIDAFQDYIEKNRVSLKEMDAIKLVEFFKARLYSERKEENNTES
ncbi:MAG TPA: TfuA-like protein [Nitrososphaera sp.]|nr:TfuA-like protein [Nitrososphaera sp.]